MIALLAPIGIFISKVVLQDILTDEAKDRIEDKVEDRIEDHIEDEMENYISTTEDEEIKTPLRQYWKECYTIFIINIVLLSLAAVVVPWFATPKMTLYIVFSVYLSIIIHSFFKWTRRGWTFLKFVALYQCSLKKMVRSKVIKHRERVGEGIRLSLPKLRLEVIESSTFWRRLLLSDEEAFIIARDKLLKSEEDIINNLLKSEENIINRLYDTIWYMLFVYGSKIVLAIIFYVLIFRLLLAPRIEDATGLSYIDSAIYPFIASIEYFFGPDFLTSIGSFLGFDSFRLLVG